VHNFITILKPYLGPADENVVVFSFRFMHYHLDMRLLQGNHDMLCDIHIFFATTTTRAEALHFSIKALTVVECSGHVQVNMCDVFCANKILCGIFHGKIKFCVFFCGAMCVIIFIGVQSVQRKYL